METPFDAFFNITGNSALDHFLGATVHIWGAYQHQKSEYKLRN